MLISVLTFFLILVLVGLTIVKKSYVLTILILFNLYIDFTIGFVPEGNLFGTQRHLFNLLILILLYHRYGIGVLSNFKGLAIFVAFLMIMTLRSTNPFATFLDVLPFATALLYLPVVLKLFESKSVQERFERTITVLLISYPIYIFVANIFGFGESYSAYFTSGYLTSSSIYQISVVIIAGFLIARYVKRESISLINILIVLNILVLILNLRRTAIAAVAISLFAALLTGQNKVKTIATIALTGVIASVFILYFFDDIFYAQLNARSRILDFESYDQEGRYLEILFLYDFSNSNFSMFEMLFGYDFMNSSVMGMLYFGYPRTIHSDYLNLFYGGGFVAVGLFFNFIFQTLYTIFKTKHIGDTYNYKITALIFVLLITFFMIPGRLIGNFPTTFLIIVCISYWFIKLKSINYYIKVPLINESSRSK